MARHHVSEGEDGLQLRRATTIVFSMQSRTDNEGGPSACGPGELLTTHNKEICILRNDDNDSTFGSLRCVDTAIIPKFGLNVSNFGNTAHMAWCKNLRAEPVPTLTEVSYVTTC
jgi:hypothetical protein